MRMLQLSFWARTAPGHGRMFVRVSYIVMQQNKLGHIHKSDSIRRLRIPIVNTFSPCSTHSQNAHTFPDVWQFRVDTRTAMMYLSLVRFPRAPRVGMCVCLMIMNDYMFWGRDVVATNPDVRPRPLGRILSRDASHTVRREIHWNW